jgi:hypothetical protein
MAMASTGKKKKNEFQGIFCCEGELSREGGTEENNQSRAQSGIISKLRQPLGLNRKMQVSGTG